MAFDISDAKARMQGAQDALQRELGSIRTGRANPRILDRIEVEYYGAMTPLNQVASISVPEARILLITPFDKSVLDEIIRAINMSDLGLNPASDGNIVRLAIPQMTEEGRKELAKQVKAEAEKAKVSVRNVRRDAMDSVKKDKELPEDVARKAEDAIQKLTDDNIKAIDAIAAGKQGAISIHRFVQPQSSLTIGRNRNDFIELDKNDIKVENYDNSSRQIPGHNDAIDTKHSFRDAKLLFTEEQVKAETARCLGCGASVVDPNKCIGCGLCTTKCEFDAIKLHRELPECSRMVPYEDRLKFVLPNMVKQSIKLKFKKK